MPQKPSLRAQCQKVFPALTRSHHLPTEPHPFRQPHRCFSHPSFYQNRIVEHYASQETKRVTLRQLTVFGRTLTEEKLLRSANYVRTELPVRLAHRIFEFQHLPFIVGTNPHIELMYNLYWEAFEKFRAVPPIQSLQDNHEFCELVQSMLDTHMVAIPQLAMGIAESSAHMRLRDADRFMNEMLRSRIGRRVLAEQHIALSAVFDGKRAQEDGWIGIVNTRCVAEDIVKRCADMAARLFRDTYGIEPPQVLVDGQLEATFKYIPDHIEYIIFELLKNSMHATIATHAPDVLSRAESGDALELDAAKPGVASETKADQRVPADPMTSTSSPSPPPSSSSTSASSPSPPSHNDQPPTAPPTPTTLPPIRVTIGESESTIMFRVSDQGGGIESSIQEHIWSYAHPSKRKFANFAQVPRLAAKVEESVSPTLKLGLGLPMSKVYADYWGGNVSMYTMFGYGTDVYVAISVGNQVENLKYE